MNNRLPILILRWMRFPLLALLAVLAFKAMRSPLQGAPRQESPAMAPQAIAHADTETRQADGTSSEERTQASTPARHDVETKDLAEPSTAMVASLPGPIEPLDPAILETALTATPPEAVAQRTIRTVEVVVGATRESLVRVAQSGRKLGSPLVSFARNFGQEVPTTPTPKQTKPNNVTRDTSATLAGAPPEPVARPKLVETVTLFNPTSNRAAITFLANGQAVTLQPGEKHTGMPETTLTVQFHRGGDFGNASEVLEPGEFVFHVRKNGWQLVDDDADVTDRGTMDANE